MKKILCLTCASWINCGKRNTDEVHGFCLNEKLFTFTAKESCIDYLRDASLDEEKPTETIEDPKPKNALF